MEKKYTVHKNGIKIDVVEVAEAVPGITVYLLALAGVAVLGIGIAQTQLVQQIQVAVVEVLVPIQWVSQVGLEVQASSSFAIASTRKEDNKWKENT